MASPFFQCSAPYNLKLVPTIFYLKIGILLRKYWDFRPKGE